MSDLVVKQVIVVRTDLKMRKGKLAAQVIHAVMKPFADRGQVQPSRLPVAVRSGDKVIYAAEICPNGTCCRPPEHKGRCDQSDGLPSEDQVVPHPPKLELVVPLTADMAWWWEHLFGKIVLGVRSEEDLLMCYRLAEEAGLPVALVTDTGRTEFRQDCPLCRGVGSHMPAVADRDAFGATCSHCDGTGKINRPTHTAVSIGPARSEDIDRITGPEGLMGDKVRLI